MSKIAELRIVESVQYPGLVSVRGPKGRGDSPQKALTKAGFQENDCVVVMLKSEFDRLIERVLDNDIPGI